MINLIVAVSKNGIIGKDGKIPFFYPADKQYFKEITTNKVLIMGRKTYEEINHPLKDRFIIVLSKTKNFNDNGIITLTSLDEALKYVKDKEVFIAGGRKLYEEALKIAQYLYITEIDEIYDGDTYFPSIPNNYQLISENKKDKLNFKIYKKLN